MHLLRMLLKGFLAAHQGMHHSFCQELLVCTVIVFQLPWIQNKGHEHTATSSGVRCRGLPLTRRSLCRTTSPVFLHRLRIRLCCRSLTEVNAAISDDSKMGAMHTIAHARSSDTFWPFVMMLSTSRSKSGRGCAACLPPVSNRALSSFLLAPL